MAAVWFAGLGGLGAAGGVLMLRRAWRRPGEGWAILVGWGLFALSPLAWAQTAGADMALALALLAASAAAYAVLASEAKVRRGRGIRPPRAEVELPAKGGPPWRAILRTLYAGPCSAAAALGCGAAFALKAPLAPVDRLILAALIAPLIWAVGMIWATTDPRLSRIGLGLTAATAAGFATAML
jgi:hypothetical protein